MTPHITIQPKTKKDLIAEILREAIISGEFVPGERLLQADLALRFEVSPTPIREAVQQLVAEGVLSHSPYRGVQVAEARLEDVNEVYMIRGVIEELATRTAVYNLRVVDARQLRIYHDDMQMHVKQGELQALRKLNYEFHMLIYRASHLPVLLNMIRLLWTKFPWDTLHVLPNRAASMLNEHQQILDAINAGDAELAGNLMRTHIESGSAALRAYLSQAGK
ncbi:MAG: GntR family transcriptional regulator [Chloroflexota bacterium]|nr:GntR family transcriptional regulator [Chloroflexota bacterium]